MVSSGWGMKCTVMWKANTSSHSTCSTPKPSTRTSGRALWSARARRPHRISGSWVAGPESNVR